MNEQFFIFQGEETEIEELLAKQTASFYKRNSDGDLLTSSEPWNQTAAAPRLHINVTLQGALRCFFREDVPQECRREAERQLKQLQRESGGGKRLVSAVQDFWGQDISADYCFLVPPLPQTGRAKRLTLRDAEGLVQHGFQWLLEELLFLDSCWGIVEDGRIVSLCRSVRIGDGAEEAGIETLPDARGRGCAEMVLAFWANDVRRRGKLPFYSTAMDNISSQRVAKKAGLQLLGFHMTIDEGQ